MTPKTGKLLFIGTLISLVFLLAASVILVLLKPHLNSPLSSNDLRQRNLSKYKFEELSKREFRGSEIGITKTLYTNSVFTAFLFSFTNDEGKKVSGQINVPAAGLNSQPSTVNPKLPIVVLLRGYVDKEIYKTGIGTKPAANFFAQNGYITLAPDFLGYGDSDPESNDILESRFEKPATVLSLLASLKNFPEIKILNENSKLKVENSRIGLWAHSNGGQIALSVLEITELPIPTTLWAPVSLGFPDSIINFVSDLPDHGDYIQKDLADFEKRYDFSPYSITTYFGQIRAPIQLHQGGHDESVPKEWSENLRKILSDLNLNLNYYYYPSSDHNLRPDWNTAVQRDLVFFQKFL